MFEDLTFGPVENGMCAISMRGEIAIKIGDEYKVYDPVKKKLQNYDKFGFEVPKGMAYVVPSYKVSEGDIILIDHTPYCVVNSDGDQVTAINYKTNKKEDIILEHKLWFGNTVFVSKIKCIMGNKKNGKSMMKMLMMMKMLDGKNAGNMDMNSMLPLMMLSGKHSFDPMMMMLMMNQGNGGKMDMNSLMMLMMLNGDDEGAFGEGIFDGMFDEVDELEPPPKKPIKGKRSNEETTVI